jgi:hypothetical protein
MLLFVLPLFFKGVTAKELPSCLLPFIFFIETMSQRKKWAADQHRNRKLLAKQQIKRSLNGDATSSTNMLQMLPPSSPAPKRRNIGANSVAAQSTKHGTSRNTNNGFAIMHGMMQTIEMNTAMALQQFQYNHRQVGETMKKNLLGVLDKLRVFRETLFSKNQATMWNRSQELELACLLDETERAALCVSSPASLVTPVSETSAERLEMRIFNKGKETLSAQMAGVMSNIEENDDPEMTQALGRSDTSIDLTIHASSERSSTADFGGGKRKFTHLSVKTTKKGTLIVDVKIELLPFDKEKRMELVKKINEQNLSTQGGGRGKKITTKSSPQTEYITKCSEELSVLYKNTTVANIKSWMLNVNRGEPIPGPKRGPTPKISDVHLVGVRNNVRARHLAENSCRLSDLDGLLLMAMCDTAKDAGTPVPSSTAAIPKSTLQTYINIMRPFLLESGNAQDKATTANRTRHGNDLRMILCNIAMVGAAIKVGVLRLNERTAANSEMRKEYMWNSDVTGYKLKNIDGRLSIVIFDYKDADVPVLTESVSKGFEQTIKLVAMCNAAGSDGGDVLFYRYMKPTEDKKSGTKRDIVKVKLDGWNGNNTAHFWLVRKGMKMDQFNYEVIDKFLFPQMMAVRERTRAALGLTGEDLTAACDRMLSTFDGEGPFLVALERFMKTKKWKEAKIQAGKFSPVTSGRPSGNPLDQGKAFSSSKAGLAAWTHSSHVAKSTQKVINAKLDFDAASFKVLDPDEGYKTDLINIQLDKALRSQQVTLQHMDDIHRFFFRMCSIYPRSFTKKNLVIGWQLGGYSPWSPLLALAACKGYTSLDSDATRRDVLHRLLPLMIKEMALKGECTDAFMDQIGLPAGVFGHGSVVTVPFDQKKALNQRRAMLLSHEVQEKKRAAVLSLEQCERMDRINEARPMLAAMKLLLKENEGAVLERVGTMKQFQGLLELLNVPGDKFLNGPRTSTNVNKPKLAELAREYVLAAIVSDEATAAAAVGGGGGDGEEEEEVYEDNFDEEDDDL